jgi:uncharacterized protein (DUF488 family)
MLLDGLARSELLTVGHGSLTQAELASLLRLAGVEWLVDVRRAPGSRRHPHFARAEMERWLPDGGVGYRWEPRLGGWRKPEALSPNTALRNDSFRGYADYMSEPAFWDALDPVLQEATDRRTAVMCSEAVYWRCHRRLIADAAVIGRAATVSHLDHSGGTSAHRLTEGVRSAAGLPVYDVGEPIRLPDV